MIRVCEPVLDGKEEQYVLDCLRSNWISSNGRYVDALEQQFSEACQAPFGVSCSSGTAALHLALVSLEIGPDDEVICPDFNLIAGTNMVILAGAKPVLVDVEPDTWCIDPDLIEENITARTKAIMAVHMYGHPCEMARIMEIANRHDLYVIEDCAEAIGAQYHGRPVGGIGHVGCFSFYANKLLTTGEGGMLVTRQERISKRAAMLRNQAFGDVRFRHHDFGFNYRLSNLLAAVGLAQLERIDEKIEQKRDIAARYTELLADLPNLRLPVQRDGCTNVYWMYGVVLDGALGTTRETLRTQLHDLGVETRDFFHPIHLQPVYQREGDPRFPSLDGDFPVSRELGSRGFYLPSGLSLTPEQVGEVVKKLGDCLTHEVADGLCHIGHL